MNKTDQPILEVKDLHTKFFVSRNLEVHAVRGINFTLNKGEIMGLVGESGSGKSVTARSLMRLVPAPGRIVDGIIRFRDTNLLDLSNKKMRLYRGRHIAMIFQNPMSSLNPVHKVGEQLTEALLVHQMLSHEKAKLRGLELLEMVGIADKKRRFNSFPHELSGGMCQRVMIAMAMACKPSLLIADEATTALDVTIQRQILTLLKDICMETGTSMILITHDMSIVAETCRSVAVMYAGEIVEKANVAEIFSNPVHPYTQALLKAIPKKSARKQLLDVIEGHPPNLSKFIQGCAFAPRCSHKLPVCREPGPSLTILKRGNIKDSPHKVKCVLASA